MPRPFTRLPKRPRPPSCLSFSTLSILFFALLAIITLCPPAARADHAAPEYGTVVGIDLGTSYSRVAVQRDGRIKIVADGYGHRITPSWASFTEEERLVGDAAQKVYHINPANTVFDAKRLIGRKFGDPDIRRDTKHWPFAVKEKSGKPAIVVQHKGRDREFTPEEISAVVLTKLKEAAEAYLGEKVTHAVITVPAYFDDAQRQATRDAGALAGLTVLRVVNEPTAAAIAYGLNKKSGEYNIIVYDLGGTTFDASVLFVEDGVFEILGTAGDSHLGGEDFDNRVVEYFVDLYKTRTGTDISEDLLALGRLKREIEKAKRTLSDQQIARLDIESFENGNDFSEVLTRAKFEELNMDLFKETIRHVEQALKDAGVKKENIDEVLLVGGSTHIPKVQELTQEFFNGKEFSKVEGINPDEAVVYGAAVQGGILSQEDCCGCNACLMFITPVALGIETSGGVFTKLVPRNSIIPNRKSKIFSTTVDNQTTISVQVFEGERPLTRYNRLMGKLELTGIPPAPRGVPKIEVIFEIDADGVLEVSAVDKGTGKSESVTIEYIAEDHPHLPYDEIERMILEAEEFAVEDEAECKHVEALHPYSSSPYGLQIQAVDHEEHREGILDTAEQMNEGSTRVHDEL
ncbi:hypothetical protein AX16_007445 [Volvariella volvacea WC 439]|nr:hypothetical protein AX16_007445 [Volvariella volvacea WC 439]